MHEKGSLFFLYLPMSSLLFFPLPFLSLPITSSSLFLFLPHPFLLKMGRSLPKGREVGTESELLPPEEGAVCGRFVSRLAPTGLGRRDPGSPPEAPPLPSLTPGAAGPPATAVSLSGSEAAARSVQS